MLDNAKCKWYMCIGLFYDSTFIKLSQLFTFLEIGSEILFLILPLDRVWGKGEVEVRETFGGG